MLLTKKFFENYLHNFNNNYLVRPMIAEIVLL